VVFIRLEDQSDRRTALQQRSILNKISTTKDGTTMQNGQFQFDSDENGATITINHFEDVEGLQTITKSVVVYQSADVPGTKAIYHEFVRESQRLRVGL
jgi:hypothetical protein